MHDCPPVPQLNGNLSVCVCSTDTESELEIVRQKAMEAGAFNAVVCDHWARGGAGARQLAEAVIAASKQPSHFQFLYDLNVCSTSCTLHSGALPWAPECQNVRS